MPVPSAVTGNICPVLDVSWLSFLTVLPAKYKLADIEQRSVAVVAVNILLQLRI
jgi:hypothetical protein